MHQATFHPTQVLHVNNKSLRVLDVENPRLFTHQGEHITHLGKMLRSNSSLAEIYLGKFRFRDIITDLFLDDTGVDQQRLRVLDLRGIVFRCWTGRQSFLLLDREKNNWDYFETDYFKVAARIYILCTTTCAGNEIGAKGAVHLAKLATYGSLVLLNLNHNRIGEKENCEGKKISVFLSNR